MLNIRFGLRKTKSIFFFKNKPLFIYKESHLFFPATWRFWVQLTRISWSQLDQILVFGKVFYFQSKDSSSLDRCFYLPTFPQSPSLQMHTQLVLKTINFVTQHWWHIPIWTNSLTMRSALEYAVLIRKMDLGVYTFCCAIIPAFTVIFSCFSHHNVP